MLDTPILIFEYDENSNVFEPPCPETMIPDLERNRLDEELFDLIDSGAFDPNNDSYEPV